QFMLRPMTCPHHFELYLSAPHSYRELPLRIAELAKLYRYELSGVLTGLIRARSFCLADAHIICADENQATTEVQGALDLISFAMGTLGFQKGEDFWYQLSLGNRTDDQKFYKDDAAWDRAEEILRQTLKRQEGPFKEVENEAAFYGPKIDIQIKDARGQAETAFTVQYDFVMPKRFKLIYTNARGREQEAIVIHRSSIGSIERTVALLLEKYCGALPLWLAPVQAAILPLGEKHNIYAQKVFNELRDAGVRVEINLDNETLGKKIKIAKTQKIPYLVVIGDKEIASQTLTAEGRTEKFEGLTLSGLITKLQMEIKEKK
ncbi:MAG: threonine--tRNA ligase, partial [Patescibacteria group bacterium]